MASILKMVFDCGKKPDVVVTLSKDGLPRSWREGALSGGRIQ